MDEKATGKRIKKAIKDAGKTQPQVAEEAQISKSYLHKIKQGVVEPPLRTVARIGRALGKGILDLTKRKGK